MIEKRIKKGYITPSPAEDLRRLMQLRYPLPHFQDSDDPANLLRRDRASADIFSREAGQSVGDPDKLIPRCWRSSWRAIALSPECGGRISGRRAIAKVR
ncbi:MAG: hypothetical protein MZV49_07200 [Rhodopseudomonas palustris]|nr:hypothetical protein [Rhodopseudomonas palustris]